MKNKISFFAVVLPLFLFFNIKAQQTPIPKNYFGINWHMPDTIGTSSSHANYFMNGKIFKMLPLIKGANPQIIRVGGNAYDGHGATFSQIGRACDSIIKLGAIPMVQIPRKRRFNTMTNWTFSPNDAADLVTYLNITKSLGIKLFSIGNEDDRYDTASAL